MLLAALIQRSAEEDLHHTDLDGDVHGVYHHRVVFSCSPSLSAGRAVHVVWDLKDSDDRQLVEGRGAAVQDDPRSCGTAVL